MSDAPGGTNSISDDIRSMIDALFSPWDRTDAPGLVVGIAQGGQVLFRKGFGMASLESAIANTPKTRMRIGSTSKHFTCLLALLLAEEGRLDIDTPIRRYFPEMEGPGGEPSLRHLMQHRGGSRCFLDLAFFCHGWAVSRIGAIRETQARQQGRNFAPGQAMTYNNSGYHLVSLAIQQVGGASFEQLLHDRLLVPLGLSDTASIRSDYDITPGMATMHVPSANGGWKRGLFPTEDLLGEGGIVSTVDDMLRWAAHLRTRERFGSAQNWAALTTPSPYPDGATGNYALGLVAHTHRGLKVLHHPGGVMGGSSSMMIVPDHDLDIVILSNGAASADVLALTYKVVDMVLRDRIGAPEATVRTADHEACLGDWWSAETGMLYSLIDEAGAIKVKVCNSELSSSLLKPARGGKSVCAEMVVSQLAFDLSGVEKDGRLTIDFASTSAAYEPVTRYAKTDLAFADKVVGHYHSADAGAQATIQRLGCHLEIVLSDGFGVFRVMLRQLAEGLVCMETSPPADQPHAVLNFAFCDEGASGFILNSIRTRNLAFHRVESAPDGGLAGR